MKTDLSTGWKVALSIPGGAVAGAAGLGGVFLASSSRSLAAVGVAGFAVSSTIGGIVHNRLNKNSYLGEDVAAGLITGIGTVGVAIGLPLAFGLFKGGSFPEESILNAFAAIVAIGVGAIAGGALGSGAAQILLKSPKE